MNIEQKTNKATIRVYIDDKEMLYSHQNIIGAINSFLPYLTNDDLDELMLRFHTIKDHRRQKEYLSKLETLKHSWPYPDTIQQPEND
jgi:transposase-like protein